MIIDYVGQELIWELMCNHPYHKNFRSFSITIRIKTPKQNKETTNFILSHIPKDRIIDIIYEDNIWVTDDEKIVKDINIRNVFNQTSTIHFMNRSYSEEIQ